MVYNAAMRGVRAAAWLVGACLAVPALAAKPDVLPPEKDKWQFGASAHFIFYSNSGEPRVRELARDLERLVEQLSQRSGSKSSPVPTAMYVFRDDRSFTPYKRNADGSVQNLSGFFVKDDFCNYVAVDGSVATPRVVLHEYLHQYSAYNFPPLPAWLDEGLAEFYSTFSATDTSAQLGRPVHEHVHWLRANTLIPLKRLFAVTTKDPEYNEQEKQGVFYAESWALTHYLVLGKPERRNQLNDYVDRLGRGQSPQEALAALGDLDALEAELRAYVKQNAFSFRTMGFEGSKVDLAVVFEPLARQDVLFRLGDLLLHSSPRRDDAAAHFRAALEVAPGHAKAMGGLALVEADAGRWEKAIAGFGQAVAAAPTDAELRIRLAGSLYSAEFESGPPRGNAIPERIVLAREHAAKAATLRPELFEAQYLLGLTYGYQVDGVEPGIAAMERAHALAPGRLDVLLALGSMQLLARQFDAARASLGEVLRSSSDPEERKRAKTGLAEVAVLSAFEEGQRTQDLPKMVATVRAALPDLEPERRAEVEKVLESVKQFREGTLPAPDLASTDAKAHLVYAGQQSSAADAADGDEGVRLAGEAAKHYRRAAELDPGQVEAWTGLAASCYRAQCSGGEGLKAAEKAVALQPDDPWAAYTLANYRIDAQQFEAARELVLPFWNLDHPVREDLRFTHVRARVEEAQALAEKGKTAEALRVLEGPLPEGEPGKEAARWVGEARESIQLRHWSDRLLAGSKARQDGQPDKARKILQDLIKNCPNKDLVGMAKTELAQVK